MIGFFHENEEYGCLSNWYPAEFDYVRHFTSSEQFMMYHKVLMFRKYDLAEQILKTSDPAKCKKIAGQKFPEFNADVWEKTCYTIVKRGVKAKFAQNENIQKVLFNTGNELLAECSPYDKKWGMTALYKPHLLIHVMTDIKVLDENMKIKYSQETSTHLMRT